MHQVVIQQCLQHLTTMMAILPPTSPTTVMGGFSLAIITEKEKMKRLPVRTLLRGYVYCISPNQKDISVDWVKWVEKIFCNLGNCTPQIVRLLLDNVTELQKLYLSNTMLFLKCEMVVKSQQLLWMFPPFYPIYP